MVTRILIIGVVAGLVSIIVSVVMFYLWRQRKLGVIGIRNYGACDPNDSNQLQINVTKPDNDTPPCRPLHQDERRCTMPCIMPSCQMHSRQNTGSTESLISDNNSLSSLLLPNFVSPVRRFSDNSWLESHSEMRKSSVRPDRFSIMSFNLENNSSEMESYDMLNLYGRGKLCISIVFNENISRLYVTINKAMYLNSYKLKDLAAFYVKLYLINSDNDSILQINKSEIVTANKNPMFEQTFTYLLQRSRLTTVKLKFVVKQSYAKAIKNSVIGGFYFYLNNEDLVVHPEWFQELWRDLRGDSKTTLDLGEVLISLKYISQPSCSLTVNIQRARNLQIRKHDDSVFARCTLLLGNTSIKSKRSVTVKADLLYPYLNHETVFGVVNMSIMEVGITVHLCSRSKIGFSHLLGKVMLGPVIYTDDKSNIAHWMDMINYPNRSITNWHKIV